MPLVESTCCMNCHKLLQRIAVLETKLLAGLPKQTEHTADGHHGPPQHTAGESCESSESQQFIPSVEEQAKLIDGLIDGTNRERDPKALETSDCHEYLVLLL